MRIMVFGADGFLGARLCRTLLEEGGRILAAGGAEEDEAVRRFRIESLAAIAGFEFAEGEIGDELFLEKQFSSFRPSAVFFLPGRGELKQPEKHLQEIFSLRVQTATKILQQAHRQNANQVVLESSYHVYGAGHRFPQKESDPCDRPLSALGAAQRAMELAAYAFALHSPVNVTVARFFSLYGPEQEENRLVPRLCQAAEARRKFPLYGDGTASRDFLFIEDAVRACLLVLQRPVPWRLVNIAGGQSFTLAQVAEQVAALADVVMHSEHLAPRPGEMAQAFADVSLAEGELGFRAEVPLEEGLRRTWQWFCQRPLPFRRPPEPRPRQIS